MPKFERRSWWEGRTDLEKKLLIAALALVVVALVFFLVVVFRKSCEEQEEECNTKYCVQAASEILEFVNLKFDPCESFYRYACGGFYKNAIKKETASPWLSTAKLLENELKTIVMNPIIPKDSDIQVLMKEFYQECINITKIDEENNAAFLSAINELGGLPLINGTDWNATDFDWANWYVSARLMGLPVNGFFNFEATTYVNETILKVTGPIIAREYSKLRLFNWMKKISAVFNEDVPSKQDSNELYDFIEDMLEYKYEPTDDEDEETDGDEASENEENHDEFILTIQNLTDTCPGVPWLSILNGLALDETKFDNSSKVFYDSETMGTYCSALEALLNETNSTVIANYYTWTFFENAHIYMDKNVRRIYEDVFLSSDDRYEVCYEAIDKRFKYAKETVYVRKKTEPKVKADFEEMIRIFKNLFIDHIKSCNWMDEETKAAALKKADEVESIVGADDEFYQPEFDKYLGLDEFKFTSSNMFTMMMEKMRKENHHLFESIYEEAPDDWPYFFKNVVEVNAFFSQELNVMIIPAPILTSIFYNKKFPAFMNYGPMGSTVGHELMHGFSISAREIVLDNGTTYDWWTNHTAEAYMKHVQCVIDEYESIPFRYRLNGTLTLEENVADYVGADIGYEAYQVWKKEHGTEKKLPGLPLTPEQIYWVQTATNFCYRKIDESHKDFEEEDVHGIPKFRVEAPARNSKYFAETFNCPVGSRMNPEVKCTVI